MVLRPVQEPGQSGRIACHPAPRCPAHLRDADAPSGSSHRCDLQVARATPRPALRWPLTSTPRTMLWQRRGPCTPRRSGPLRAVCETNVKIWPIQGAETATAQPENAAVTRSNNGVDGETRTPNLLCLSWVLVNVGQQSSIVVVTRAETLGTVLVVGHYRASLGIVCWGFLGSFPTQKLILVVLAS